MKYRNWKIPQSVMNQTMASFKVGHHEVFAIWTAAVADDAVTTAEIQRCIIPQQTPGASPTGVWVHIPGAELQRIQLDNFRNKERGVIQLHTHPGRDVTMSALDREWEVVRHVGALSIIVPHYGLQGLQLYEGANVYEREDGDWRLWSRAEAKARLETV